MPKVEKDYGILLELRRHCLGLMVAGRRIGDVAGAASTFLSEKHPDLLGCLPKVRSVCSIFNHFHFYRVLVSAWALTSARWPWC